MCSLQFCTCWPSFWKVVPRLNVASRRANYSAIRWMEESINPFKMSSTTILVKHIYHVHNLHMLWRCIYLSPHHISAALIGQDFWSYVLPLPWILVTSWGGNHSIVQWSWDYQPIQHGFHKLCQNVSMVFHDADVHVCETLSRYCSSCRPSFWKLPRNLVISQRGQTKVQCSGESYQHNQNSCHIIDKHI